MGGIFADLILLNGRVHTVDPALPWAQAIACHNGRILAVGSNDEIAELAGGARRTEVIDVGGRLVLPGFTDAHVHFAAYAKRRQEVALDGVDNLDGVRHRVRQGVERTPPGGWVEGWGWDESAWDAPPHRSVLDAVAPDTPVVLKRVDMHTWWVNSTALRQAGITRDTPQPAVGRIERDAGGEPTGLLREWGAIEYIEARLPAPDEATLDAWLLDAIAEAHSLGITGIHDQRVRHDGRASLRSFQRLHSQGRLDLRVHCNVAVDHLPLADELGLCSGFGDDRLWLGHMKAFADGSMGSATAWMLEPYAGRPDDCGLIVTPMAEIEAMIRHCAPAGWRIAVHAIGDRAVREVLDAFQRAGGSVAHPTCSGGMLHRIEHIQLIHPADMPRLQQVGIAASMQPAHLTMDRHIADQVWGERARRAYALRSLLNYGTEVAFGSDAPVAPFNPLIGIAAAVIRQDVGGDPPGGWYPEERISVDEAVRGYTLGPATVAGRQRLCGSLVPGKVADVVVLSADLFSIGPADIADAAAYLTVFDGRVVFSRD